MSNSFQPHGLQHTRFLCPSLSPRVSSNSCPLSLWCYLTISFSAAHFSFCLHSFPASGFFFPLSQLFTSVGQRIGSFSFSISPSNEYSELISFRIDSFDLLAIQWTLKSLLQHHSLKASILQCSPLFMVQLAWCAAVHRVTTSWTQLSDWTTTYTWLLEKP